MLGSLLLSPPQVAARLVSDQLVFDPELHTGVVQRLVDTPEFAQLLDQVKADRGVDTGVTIREAAMYLVGLEIGRRFRGGAQ
jgi:hypothetical protein